jgi:hypothetical protein
MCAALTCSSPLDAPGRARSCRESPAKAANTDTRQQQHEKRRRTGGRVMVSYSALCQSAGCELLRNECSESLGKKEGPARRHTNMYHAHTHAPCTHTRACASVSDGVSRKRGERMLGVDRKERRAGRWSSRLARFFFEGQSSHTQDFKDARVGRKAPDLGFEDAFGAGDAAALNTRHALSLGS